MYKKLFIFLVFTSILMSQFNWQDDGLPLRQGVHIEWQRTGDVASDGAMIIAWSDTRNSIRDIYAQKIDSNGNFLWDENGAVVVDVDGRQEDPLLVSDDNGGAYIIWRDYRDENYYGDIYAQHIDSNGNQLWDINGVPLSSQSGEQSSHNLCVDGNGGAFAVWADKNGSGTYRGTHLGSLESDVLTTGDGVLLSNHQSGGFSLEYAGNSSAVMVWSEGFDLDVFECNSDVNGEIYSSLDECLAVCGDENQDGIINEYDCDSGSLDGVGDIRAQRFNMDMESLWNEDDSNSGKVICDDEYLQHKSKVTTFGDNVVVVWRDLRSDPDGDVYAQILDSDGNNILEENGVIVCDDEGQQASPRVKTDGINAYIYWEDRRDNNVDPYVQKMDQDGNLMWTNNGVQLVGDAEDQDQVRMSVDHNGGAFFVWMDGRGDNNSSWAGSDIYATHIDSDGNITFDSGIIIDDDSGSQIDPLIKCNNSGDAYMVWSDRKDGSNIGIEAQVLTTQGIELQSNGKEIWYGVEGNALISDGVSMGNGSYLVAWEDNRYLSTGHPGSYTYGLLVEENMNLDSHESSTQLSLNPYQGPHGANYYYRAKLAKANNAFMMNFHQYDGPYRQYTQMFNEDLNILGDNQGTAVDSDGEDQRFSDICAVNDNFYLAYSNLVSSGYGIYLEKYNSSGESLWGNPINIVDFSSHDNLVKAILPNPLNNNLIVIYHEENFMGVNLKMVSVSEDGEVLTQMSLCSDCENPSYESHAIGDNELIVTYRSSTASLKSGVYSQIFSYTGEMLGDFNGVLIADEINDQRSSDITYNSELDEYLACWDDGRDSFINNEGDEVADLNILCARLIYDGSLILSDEIPVAYIQGSQQQNPSVFSTHLGTYLIGWEDMRSASGIDQSLNLSFEWDAYFQEIDLNGAIYQDGGIPLSTSPFGQVNIHFGVLSEEENLYLAFWEDDRSTGKELLTNIYAQLVSPSSASGCLIFDVNADGDIDILDVIQMVNIVLGNLTPDAWQECASDANGDENTDILDVIQAVQFILNS